MAISPALERLILARLLDVPGERGEVHAFRPSYTRPDPADPTKRVSKTTKTWCWRFTCHGREYRGGGARVTPGGRGYRLKREALEAGRARQAEVMAGLESDPRKTTFAALEFVLTQEYSLGNPRTAAMVKVSVARLRQFFGGSAREITRPRIIAYVQRQRAAGYRDSTIRQDLWALRRALGLAHEQGLILAVPSFPRLAVERRQQTVRPDELEAILRQLPAWWVPVYLVAAEVGWRCRSELRTRRWADVDFEEGWLRLAAGESKTRKPRAFPLTEYLRALLERQRAHVDDLERETGQVIPWVFCRPDGRRLGDERKAWQSACKRAGFGKLEDEHGQARKGPWSGAKVPHDIRRTVLRRWDALMAPLAVRMAAGGHDSTATHAGYIGGDPESLRAFAVRLDEERQRREAQKVVPIRRASGG